MKAFTTIHSKVVSYLTESFKQATPELTTKLLSSVAWLGLAIFLLGMAFGGFIKEFVRL